MSNKGSIHVDVSPGLNRLKKFKKHLDKREIRRGISKAVNQALREGRDKAKEVVGNSHNIPKKYLNSIVIAESNDRKLSGVITADTTPLPLKLFSPMFNKFSPNGVSFEVLKGKRSRIKYAFMLPGKKDVLGRGSYLSGPPWGFVLDKRGKRTENEGINGDIQARRKRKTPPRYPYPLTKLITVSVNGAMNGTRNKRLIENFIERNLPKKLREELQRRIDKLPK